jgi:hypothetical protein
MDKYPPLITELLAIPCRMPLGPGAPGRAADMLRSLAAVALFAPAALRHFAMGRACLAGP